MLIAATGTVLLEAPAFGACLSAVEVAAMVAAYPARSARTAAANPEGLSAADGECSRATLLQLLEARHGKPLGYRAGLGAELDRGNGSDVLGHPLAAVAWLAQDLAREGRALKKGDLVSLGSFSKLMPPKPGLAVEAAYEGLPGAPKVKVTFK